MATTETEMRASTGRSGKGHLVPDDGQTADIVQVLGSQLHQYEARIEGIQRELDIATSEKQELVDALRGLLGQSNALQVQENTHCDVLLFDDEDLRASRNGLASLREESLSVREDCAHAQDVDGQDLAATRELRAAVESDYHEALFNLEQELKAREAAAAEQEKDKAELFRRIMLLERRCAELDGLRADREHTCAELRRHLADRSRQVERMNRYVVRVQRELKILNDEIDSAGSGISPLDAEFDGPDDEIAASAEPPAKVRTSPFGRVTQLRSVTSHKKEQSSVLDETRACRNEAGEEEFDQASVPEQFIVVPIREDGQGPQYPLNKKELTIGRGPGHDIPVHERHVSRDHARIVLRGFKVFIEDLGSKYGLLVNSEPKERHELKHGDRFTIGRQEFEFVDLAVRASGLRTTPAA